VVVAIVVAILMLIPVLLWVFAIRFLQSLRPGTSLYNMTVWWIVALAILTADTAASIVWDMPNVVSQIWSLCYWGCLVNSYVWLVRSFVRSWRTNEIAYSFKTDPEDTNV